MIDDPEIFFLPLAVPEPLSLDAVDAGILARRLPDFVHHLLNRGGPAPTGMLEIQSPPGDGPLRWVTLTECPAPEDVRRMLGDAGSPRAIVSGIIRPGAHGLRLDLSVHFAADAERSPPPGGVEGGPAHWVHAVVSLKDPAQSMCKVARHLAVVLGILFPDPPLGMLTTSAAAFFKFLEGLDGAALLSGDPDLERDKRGAQLMEPFAEALRIDPRFGLALRTAATTFFLAMDGERVGEAACYRVIDRCFDTLPTDGEGCVAVAEHLALLGDDSRAQAWLQHAVALDPPAPRALESLGVIFANRGDLVAARNLWLRGLGVNGHPDFLAHLARLAFSEDQKHDAWDKVLRGVRRIFERAVRPGEWEDDLRGVGIMLRYLAEHLSEEGPPEAVVEAVVDLKGVLVDPAARVDLGLCLAALRRPDLAGAELEAGLRADLPVGVRDSAVRALLVLQVEDFERRFAQAAEQAQSARDPRPALIEMQAYLERQPEFWPAVFFAGVALRRLGNDDHALDLMADVLSRRPGQTDALVEMAVLFDRRGNPKRALECVDEALSARPADAALHARKCRYLQRLGRTRDALESVVQALELEPENAEYRRIHRRLT